MKRGNRFYNLMVRVMAIVVFAMLFLSSYNGAVTALTYQTQVTPTFFVKESLSMTVDNSSILIGSVAPGQSVDSNTITITVSSNSASGYTLTGSVGDGSTGSTTNLTSSATGATFASLATSASLSTLTAGSWGVAYKSSGTSTWSNYTGLPLNSTSITPKTLRSTSGPTASDVTNFKVGARAATTQLAGTYENVINFAATVNTPTIYYMQDVDFWKDSLSIGMTVTARDARDGRDYKVSKLLDGSIWMLDNLAFSDAGYTMSSVDTDLPSGTTYQFPHASGTWVNSYTDGYIYAANKDFVPSADASATSGGWKAGTYYNFCAASAGTYCNESTAGIYDAEYSVCPAGWTLPSSAEYITLSKYSNYSSAANWRATLHIPLVGYYDASGLNGGNGGTIYIWSSTLYTASRMTRVAVYSDSYTTTGTDERIYGLSVRCVARKTMQSIASWKDNLPSGQTTVAVDARDNRAYRVGKMSDGTVWLKDNLAFSDANYTMNSANTDLTPGRTYKLPYASGTWVNNAYNVAYLYDGQKDQIASDDLSQGGTWKKGTYYNYCAFSAGSYCMSASAGSGDATQSICPAGWRMPTIDEYSTVYANNSNNIANFRSALRIPMAGYYQGGSGDLSGATCLWSSTYGSASGMQDVYISSETKINLPWTDGRWYGLNGRCVAR